MIVPDRSQLWLVRLRIQLASSVPVPSCASHNTLPVPLGGRSFPIESIPIVFRRWYLPTQDRTFNIRGMWSDLASKLPEKSQLITSTCFKKKAQALLVSHYKLSNLCMGFVQKFRYLVSVGKQQDRFPDQWNDRRVSSLIDWLTDWLIDCLYAPWANKFQYQW